MPDHSNAGQRVLGARRSTQGAADALANLAGDALHDGAQCYVIEEQATYRFVANCELPADGKFVVAPIRRGRFIRESGLAGFAFLEDGIFERLGQDGVLVCQGYRQQKLVQFESRDDGSVVYIGAIPRLALLFASARVELDGQGDVYVRLDNQAKLLASGVIAGGQLEQSYNASLAGAAMLLPGDALSLRCRVPGTVPRCTGSLRLVLT